MIVLAAVCLALALLPALLYARNMALYRPLPAAAATRNQAVSILIPARNEEAGIGAAVAAAIAATDVELEVIVLDDHSTDRTRAIVEEWHAKDQRVRVELAPPLPEGWCGKQHACQVLSTLARHDILIFVDADVRLAATGPARMAKFLEQSNADLISGIPLQETGTLLEKLLIPLIHFLLLGFLPLSRMRQSGQISLGAGCGQLFAAKRAGYEAAGGHAAIRTSLHDGLTLPRSFRKAGRMTDLFDATDIATCRMYRSAHQVWFGLAKNAREGLAAPRLIVPATLLLGFGQIIPVLGLGTAGLHSPATIILFALATVAAYYPRIDGIFRFHQSIIGAIFHPLGITLLLTIQWFATLRALVGKPSGWKGRTYPAG